MKIKLTILLSIIAACSYCQEYGDTLYVIAYNGVNLRSQASTASTKINALPFGTPLMYCADSHDDRFEARNGRWIEVEYNHQSAFVFDGFLIDKKPPPSRKLTIDQIGAYIEEAYGEGLTHVVNDDSKENGLLLEKKVSHFSSGLEVTYKKYASSVFWVYAFPKLRSRDLINLIDLAFSNYNTEKKTLVSHFMEDKFWRGRDPDKICPSAFNVKISKLLSIQYDYSRKRMDVDPIPKIIIHKKEY